MVDEATYRNPSLAADAIALRDGPRGAQVLLITRGFPPWEGRLAFPGGFVEVGEDPENAVPVSYTHLTLPTTPYV